MAKKVLFGKPNSTRGLHNNTNKLSIKKSLSSGVSSARTSSKVRSYTKSGKTNSGTSPISVKRNGPTFNRNIYNKKQVTYGK